MATTVREDGSLQDAEKVAARSGCACFSSGFDEDCPEHTASVRGRCKNWKRYQGTQKPTCWKGKGCPMCWEKYNARVTVHRILNFYCLKLKHKYVEAK